MPWVHYVPLKVDYSDLYDSMLLCPTAAMSIKLSLHVALQSLHFSSGPHME